MEVRPGYKPTAVGVIPEEWSVESLINCCDYVDYRGKTPHKTQSGTLLITARNVRKGFIDYEESKEYVATEQYELIMRRGKPQTGDVIITTEAPLGNVAQIDREDVALAQRIIKYCPKSTDLYSNYLKHYLLSDRFQAILDGHASGSTARGIKGSVLHQLPVVIPPPREQEAIAQALSDADDLIESLEQLLTKKRQLRQGAMQVLLTGKMPLPGFSVEWEVKRIADIASPSSEKNSGGERLTVLTCSKRLGFVDSLGYFKNQVFSSDTSGYKVIRRGQIGYPSNHVEEGSIGLQDLYDVAVVSPIYVVFSVTEEVDSYFLHRLLKLDSYRHEFATATSSSVDRRGSLRWPAFSEITVSLPPVQEQTAIATILRDMDVEIAALEAKLAKAGSLKQGMMQELLTGRIRLV